MDTPHFILLLLLLLWLLRREEKKKWMSRFGRQTKTEDKIRMQTLAKRFLEKECIIYTFNGQITGTLREVTDGAILLESGSTLEAVNLEYIVRIREYPRKKNGKKKMIVAD